MSLPPEKLELRGPGEAPFDNAGLHFQDPNRSLGFDELQGVSPDLQPLPIALTPASEQVSPTTRIRQLEAENKRLRDENHGLRTLAYLFRVLAHEAKTPLTLVKGYSQILCNRLADSQPTEAGILQTIIQAANQVTQEINSTVDISRRLVDPKPEVIAVADFIQQIFERKKRLLESFGMNIEFPVLDKTAMIFADPTRLQFAYNALISNACEATQSRTDPKITTMVAVVDGSCIIRISDNGTGMDERTLARCTEPNFTTKQTGTGIGLSSAKKFIQEACGAFTITSKPGMGTEIEASYPLYQK